MEYKGFKIDFTALAALVGAVGGLLMAIKGRKQQKRGDADVKESKDKP